MKAGDMIDVKKIKIAVLMGGFSSEREVSLNSGRRVIEALRSLGCRAEEVDVRDKQFKLPTGTDVAFIALHGTGGEDGVVQSILEKRGVAFTGSGSKSSKLAFDKVAAKKVFRENGLSTPRDFVVRKTSVMTAGSSTGYRPGFPCVVKPSREGSSIGIHIVKRKADMDSAMTSAFERDDTILVEEFIDGRELTVGILGDRVLPVIEIRPKSGWFDYANKYTEGATDELVPAPIEPALAQRVQEEALKAHQILGCRDLSRSDFRVDARGKTWLLELNTIPGMTATSLLPKAAAADGIPFPHLCLALVERAMNRGGSKT